MNVGAATAEVEVSFKGKDGIQTHQETIYINPGEQVNHGLDTFFTGLPPSVTGNLYFSSSELIAVSDRVHYASGWYEVTGATPGESVAEFWIRNFTEPSGLWFFGYLSSSKKYSMYQWGYNGEGDLFGWGMDEYGDPVLAGYVHSLGKFILLDPSFLFDYASIFSFTATNTVSGCMHFADGGADLGPCYSLSGTRFDAEDRLAMPPVSEDRSAESLAWEASKTISWSSDKLSAEVLQQLEKMREMLQ